MDDLVKRLQNDLPESLKRKDRLRTSVIRMLLAEIKTAETAARAQKRSAQEAVAAYAKRLKKTVGEYRRLNQIKRADENERELEIVEAYLPRPLSREEIQRHVAEVISQHGFTSQTQVGDVMKLIMRELGDRVEGKVAQEIVREKLVEP